MGNLMSKNRSLGGREADEMMEVDDHVSSTAGEGANGTEGRGNHLESLEVDGQPEDINVSLADANANNDGDIYIDSRILENIVSVETWKTLVNKLERRRTPTIPPSRKIILRHKRALSLYRSVVLRKIITLNSPGSQSCPDWETKLDSAVKELMKYRDVAWAWRTSTFRRLSYSFAYKSGWVTISGFNIDTFVDVCAVQIVPYHYPVYGSSLVLAAFSAHCPWNRLTEGLPVVLKYYGMHIKDILILVHELRFDTYQKLSGWLTSMPNLERISIKHFKEPQPLPDNLSKDIRFPHLSKLKTLRSTPSRYGRTPLVRAIATENPQLAKRF